MERERDVTASSVVRGRGGGCYEGRLAYEVGGCVSKKAAWG